MSSEDPPELCLRAMTALVTAMCGRDMSQSSVTADDPCHLVMKEVQAWECTRCWCQPWMTFMFQHGDQVCTVTPATHTGQTCRSTGHLPTGAAFWVFVLL